MLWLRLRISKYHRWHVAQVSFKSLIGIHHLKLNSIIRVGHSRAGGNPGVFELNSRLRGSDNHFPNFGAEYDNRFIAPFRL